MTDREMLIDIRGTVNRTAEDVSVLRRDHGTLADRVANLEREAAFDRGSKHGFERSLRIIQTLAGICGLSGVAAAAKIVFGGG